MLAALKSTRHRRRVIGLPAPVMQPPARMAPVALSIALAVTFGLMVATAAPAQTTGQGAASGAPAPASTLAPATAPAVLGTMPASATTGVTTSAAPAPRPAASPATSAKVAKPTAKPATPPAPRWWQVPLADRLNAALDAMSGRVNTVTQKPLGDQLNAGLDNIFAGVSLLWRPPPGGGAAWWEKPLADRLNARLDAVSLTIKNLEVKDVVREARNLGLDGPTIFPSKVLPQADGVIDPDAPMNLLQAWQAARANDPNLRAARAGLAAAGERVPQARAQMLPQVQASASRIANDLAREGQNAAGQALNTFDRYPSSNESITLRQPVLRGPLVAGIRQAQAQVREAEAQYTRDQQESSSRIVLAYLEVLLAQDTVQFIESQRQFLESAVAASQSAFERGAGTRTDVDAARAKLDFNRAQALEARQQQDFARRQLQVFTARPFGQVVPLDGSRVTQSALTSRSLEEWLNAAEQSSPEVRRLRAQRDGLQAELNKARAGHLPTVDVIAQSQRSRSENTLSPQARFTNNSVGVQVTVPIYSGGLVNSAARQAGAEIERVEELMQALKADLGVRVHREYRGVVEGLARVKALEVARQSAEVALDSARKSVLAGVRTQVDVLNADQQRMQVMRDLAQARYSAIAALVKLQALVGEADEALVARLNGLLAP